MTGIGTSPVGNGGDHAQSCTIAAALHLSLQKVSNHSITVRIMGTSISSKQWASRLALGENQHSKPVITIRIFWKISVDTTSQCGFSSPLEYKLVLWRLFNQDETVYYFEKKWTPQSNSDYCMNLHGIVLKIQLPCLLGSFQVPINKHCSLLECELVDISTGFDCTFL